MSCRLQLIIYLFFAIIILSQSCEKLEIPQINDEEETENSDRPGSPDSDPNNDNKDNNNKQDDGNSDVSDGTEDNTEVNEDDPYQGWGSLYNQINNGGTLNKPFRAKDLAKGDLGEWIVSENVESMSNCWVEGYIVGYVKGNRMSSAILFKNADRESNILIASDTINIEENDCVPIGLSKSSSNYIKTRDALNLKTNTNIMRRKVKILGSIGKYMGVAGLKNAKDYRWIEN